MPCGFLVCKMEQSCGIVHKNPQPGRCAWRLVKDVPLGGCAALVLLHIVYRRTAKVEPCERWEERR